MDMFDKKGTESLDIEILQGILFSMPMRFEEVGKRVFVVCDALDEMDEHKQRQVLLPMFHDMANAGFKLFLTSRPYPADVRTSFALLSN
jgi:hypothetical protein